MTSVPDLPSSTPPSDVPGTGAAPAGGDPTAGPVTDPVTDRRRWRLVLEWSLVLLVAFAVAIGVRTFVAQTFFIPSASMEPTLMIGDRILVDKLSYHLHPVHRATSWSSPLRPRRYRF